MMLLIFWREEHSREEHSLRAWGLPPAKEKWERREKQAEPSARRYPPAVPRGLGDPGELGLASPTVVCPQSRAFWTLFPSESAA